MALQALVFAAVFVLLQHRMDVLAWLLPGGPVYAPATHGEVVLLTTAGCRFCASEKRYLNAHDVPFRELDVGNDRRGAALLAATGSYGVPVLLVGEEVVHGFDPLRIRAAFRRVAEAHGVAGAAGAEGAAAVAGAAGAAPARHPGPQKP